MYPFLRLTRVIIQSLFEPKIAINSKETHEITLIVMPQDIDPFLELNNGRYVTLLDLGRFSHGAKVNMRSFLKENNWSLTIVGTYNEYRHRLRLFQRFKLKTNIIGYDKNWFYFFQRVERNNKIYMASVVKFSFTNKNGIVKPDLVAPKMGETFNPNQIPGWINELSKHQLFKKFA